MVKLYGFFVGNLTKITCKRISRILLFKLGVSWYSNA